MAAGPSLMSAATATVFVIAPVAAGAAAWQTGRLRRSDAASWAPQRSRLVIVVDAVAPVAAVAWAVLGLAVARVVVADPRPPGGWGAGALPMVAAAVAVIAGWVAIGAVAGSNAPTIAAVPGVVIVAYGAIVFPIAMDPLWLRHLTGFRSACCVVDSEVVPAAVLAPGIVALGVTGGAAVLVAGRSQTANRTLRAVAALVVVAGAVGAVLPSVADLGPDPTRERSSGLACQAGAGASAAGPATVCLWAEHEGQRAAVDAAAAAMAQALDERGVTVPSRVTERPATDGADDVWSFGTSSTADGLDVAVALAGGLMGSVTCIPELVGPDGLPLPLDAVAGTWLVLAADHVTPDDIAGLDPSAVAIADTVLAGSLEDQGQWFAGAVAALRDCDVVQPPLPPATSGP